MNHTRTNRWQLLALALLASPVLATAADRSDLSARWQLDRDHHRDGRFAAIAGNLPAVVVGPVAFADDGGPAALLLDGDSKKRHRVRIADDINAARAILPVEAFSVEAWVRVDRPTEWGGMVSSLQDNGSFEKGWLLGFHKSRFVFGVSARTRGRLTYLESRRLFETGHWYHVLGTYDGKRQRLYVDGELLGESTHQSGPIDYPPTGVVTLGAYQDDNELYSLAGRLARVSIWKRALDSKQVQIEFKAMAGRFPGIVAARPRVVGWPTWQRDNQRTGITGEPLEFPLACHWVHRARRPPSPAWPLPANQDFWHKKHGLKTRVTYDRAFGVVSDSRHVLFGSSSEDTIHCLDAASGRTLWTTTAEGPIRLAPTIAGDRVLYGSDDGHVYCLDLADGRRLWRHRGGPADERIAGNSRIISAWPIRTGVLVEDGVAYFCAGLFPVQGVYQVAVDVASGRRLASNRVNVSAQGYLSRRSGRLFVATGRDPAGSFVAGLKRRGKGIGREVSTLSTDYRFAFVGAVAVRVGGAAGHVAAFAVDDGHVVWRADVEGTAWSLAIAGGRLFVSTDTGRLYCFGPQRPEPFVEHAPPPLRPLAADPGLRRRVDTLADRCLAATGRPNGYALVLSAHDGLLVEQLARRSQLQVVGIDADPKRAAATRQRLVAAGLGGRATIQHISADAELPFADYLFNLVTDRRLADREPRPADFESVSRVVRPYGGVAVLAAGVPGVHRRGPLAGAGEWSHMYANTSNTVCSDDRLVGSKLALQWFGPPGPRQMIDRHHRTVAPLVKSGRLFIPGDDRVIGVDVYNGTVLWNRTIAGSRRVGVFRDCSYLAAADESLYVAAAGQCLRLDADTGKTLAKFPVPRAADGRPRDWGYLAVVGDLLVGSAVKPGASRRSHSRATILEGTYHDHRPLVGSDFLFALDRKTGRHAWSYHPGEGLLVNPTLTIHARSITFVESLNAETLKHPSGRARPADLLKRGALLVSIELETGSIRWSRKHDFSAIQHNIFLAASAGRLAVVGTRNDGTDPKKSRVCYDIHVFSADNGDRQWSRSQTQSTGIGGDHGEQDHHPVIVSGTLYCEPFAYELANGRRRENFAWKNQHRRGCGTISASASTLFFRDSTASTFDLGLNRYARVTSSTRPGCWINMIPAGGLLLVPEASSGCTCNFAVQTSLAFRPVK